MDLSFRLISFRTYLFTYGHCDCHLWLSNWPYQKPTM